MPTRRGVLAGVGIAAVLGTTGCLDLATADTAGEPGRALHLDLSRWDGSLRGRYVEDLAANRSAVDGPAFRDTLDGETVTTRYRPPFGARPEDPTYTRHDGTYYRLGSVVVDESTVTHPVLRLREADTDSPAVRADRLPEVDRTAIQVAHMAERARENAGGAPWGLIERGGFVYRTADAVAASRLLDVDGPSSVRYRDRRYAVSVSHEYFHEPVYRATVTPVAETPERMEAILRARLLDARLDRGDLSRDARGVVREADAGGYAESHPFSDGFRAVLLALDERAYLDGNISNDALADTDARQLLRYDGDYYDYTLRFIATE